ncbi:MAG: hypothetical protein ACRD72_11350 [Candidatus Angelobacter sp.]
MRIQVEVDDEAVNQIEELKRLTGLKTYKDLFNNSIAILWWATNQRRNGRIIASIDEQKHEFKELQMPVLEYAAHSAEVKEGAA